MLLASLKGLNHSENLLERSANSSWVRDRSSDLLLGVDDEDGSDSKWQTLVVDVGRVKRVEHVVLGAVEKNSHMSNAEPPGTSSAECYSRNLSVLVANDGVVNGGATDLVDVLDPSVVGLNVVGA